MNITISEEVKALCPGTALGILHYTALVQPSSPELLDAFEAAVRELAGQYEMSAIAKNPRIAATRQAYKALGKSPQEYRNAAEAMLRRVVKNTGLYHINNIVEINNLISITSGYSIGSYDAGGLTPPIELRRAEDGAHYGGIGKGSINIEHLPVLYDALGPFGNPTSDSRRAMIQEGEQEIISVLYAFDGPEPLRPWLQQYADALERYCSVKNLETRIV